MKKTITLMLLLAIAGSANADLVLNGPKIQVCPGVLTKSGASVAYSYNSDGIAYIYSQDFLVDKTITKVVPGEQYISVEEEGTVVPTGVNVVPEDQYGNRNYSMYDRWEASSQEDMINKLKEMYNYYTFTAFTDPFGNPACYNSNSNRFAYENLFGKKYPYEWYALVDGMVYEFSAYYNNKFYTLAYDEESAVWIRTSENIRYTAYPFYYFAFQMDGMEGESVYFSQTLFNDDDKWEYVVREYGPVKFSYSYSSDIVINEDGTVTLTRSGSGSSEVLGCAVYNEDGVKLADLPWGYPECIYIMNGRKFIQMYNMVGDISSYTYTLYEIKGGNDDFDLVETVQAKSDCRLGATRGIVTVDISAEQAGGEVVVSTTDGKVMASKKVGMGQTQVNDQPLPTGIYVVSLLKDGRVVESEKYLVQ